MAKYVEPSKCITPESTKEDARRRRLRLIAKYIVVIPIILRALMEISKHV